MFEKSLLKGPHKDILGNVLGALVRDVFEHDPEYHPAIFLQQQFERIDLAAQHPLNDPGVVGFNRLMIDP